jgi:hypothetical protein
MGATSNPDGVGRADNIQNVAGLFCPNECGIPSR